MYYFKIRKRFKYFSLTIFECTMKIVLSPNTLSRIIYSSFGSLALTGINSTVSSTSALVNLISLNFTFFFSFYIVSQ
ncbi:hypothetical protein GIB67_028808 [Kingdonia uniflora]|uniref:Uncharacterized protein n=1 Tax=Kingdonia uniflora TaxID=39325 RepID=A0A7J7LT31_9MAGN|nr:hypothetical protein GIB67_028808 [Kingdonia uniflora]